MTHMTHMTRMTRMTRMTHMAHMAHMAHMTHMTHTARWIPHEYRPTGTIPLWYARVDPRIPQGGARRLTRRGRAAFTAR
jgi:hypothetical protein